MAILPVVTLLAGRAMGMTLWDPTTRAETLFLAFSLALATTATLALDRGRGGATLATAAFGTLVLWVVPPGPARGATMTALLLVGIGLAARAGWSWTERRMPTEQDPIAPTAEPGDAIPDDARLDDATSPESAHLDGLWTFGLAFGIQILAQPRLLLRETDPEALACLLGLPFVVALVTTWLARHAGRTTALGIAAAAGVCGPGWTPENTGLLVVVACAACTRVRATSRSIAATAMTTALVATAAWWFHGLGMAWFVVIVGAAISHRLLASLSVTGFALALALGGGGHAGAERLISQADRVSLLPSALLAAIVLALGLFPTLLARFRRLELVGTGVLLLVHASFLAPVGPGHAIPFDLHAAGWAALALHVGTSSQDRAFRRSWLSDWWCWWLGIVGTLTVARAAYPWGQLDPLRQALGSLGFGLGPGMTTSLETGLESGLAAGQLGLGLAFGLAIVVAAVAATTIAIGARTQPPISQPPAGQPSASQSSPEPQSLGNRHGRWAGIAAALTAGALITFGASVPRPSSPPEIVTPTRTLEAARGGWRQPLATVFRPRAIVIDSSAIASLGLRQGQTIAEAVLVDADNVTLGLWPPRIGLDTGEWAAERSDVAATLVQRGVATPGPGHLFVVADNAFFGRRFRSQWVLEQPLTTDAAQLIVRLAPNLPPEVGLRVDRIEIVP